MGSATNTRKKQWLNQSKVINSGIDSYVEINGTRVNPLAAEKAKELAEFCKAMTISTWETC